MLNLNSYHNIIFIYFYYKMSQGFTKTTIIECPRSQSDEAIGNNNSNPSKWTNRVGDGIHLKPGDTISVHSSYISEIGAEAGQIQIKGKSLNASVEVETTIFDKLLYQDDLPSKYTLINASNQKQYIDIRDDTFNIIVSPYKCANGEYYSHLPRRWNGSGITLNWKTNHSRDVTPVDGDIGQTILPPPPLNRCKADINTKYWGYNSGVAHTRYRVDGINDGSRYTLFTRRQTYYGNPNSPTIELTGEGKAGSDIIKFTHGATTADLIVGMELIAQSPTICFLSTPTIVSIDSLTEITMSATAIANSNTHNLFTFQLPATSSDQFLPPTTANSSFIAETCESARDPALWGDYIQVKNLISVKANPGYNSPTDLADQLTQEINERSDLHKFQYDTTATTPTFTRRETFTVSSETPAYKLYNCATASNFSKADNAEWIKTDGSWNVDDAYHYLSSFQTIGIKRPELYTTGLKVNGSLINGSSYLDGYIGERNGLGLSRYFPMGKGESILITDTDWTKENILRFKDFFEAQATYPELFDYTQSGFQCGIDETRFLHLNLYDNGNGSFEVPAVGGVREWNLGSNIRDIKCPFLGYDLYNSTISASQTSFPIFIDYNPNTRELTENDVGYTDRGFNYFYDGLEPDYNDLAYGFARKIRTLNVLGEEKYYIGFQFTRTGNKIPDHFFHTNASAHPGEPTEVLGVGQRQYGFDWHFTAYGTAAMILYNGNSNTYGSNFASTVGSSIWTKIYRFAQATADKVYDLDPYQFAMYVGADSPIINYSQDQQRFQIQSLHSAEVVGNIQDASYVRPTGTAPSDPNGGDPCAKINKRLLKWNYNPDMAPYTDDFTGSYTGGSDNSYISHNVAIEPYTIMDAQSGLFIEDWIVPEELWDESLIGIMGFRYNQFHNPDSTSSRQVRLKAHGANADLHNVNILTTNADVGEGDLIEFQQNPLAVGMFSPVLPVATQPGGPGFTHPGRYITPAITISPVQSVNITAERLPTKTLRPYYTIRSDIIAEPNRVLGGLTSGITMPIVAITNKANPYGDFLNGFQGQMTFTNTIDRVITRIRCSIHEPDGSAARCDLNSAVIFRIDQQVNANMDVVGDLLQSKKKSDQIEAEEAEDPQLQFQNVKYNAKDLFQ